MFGLTQIEISDSVVFYFLNIEDYTPEFIQFLDSEICKICEGDENEFSNISSVKIKMKNFICGKDERQKHGIVAEFICHLFLRSLDYKQLFLFKNLEENSLKKGFDGLYKKSGEMWLFESKSSTTNNTSHEVKIKEAYTDLKTKIEGTNNHRSGYNPWENAYNHAMHRGVCYDKSILKTLNELSDKYLQNKYSKINDYNIIPSSTIYLDKNWCKIDSPSLCKKLMETISNYDYKKLNVMCVNKKDINCFIEYING